MGTSPPLGGRPRPIARALARVGLPLVMVLAFSGSALAFHWQTDGWRDLHVGYPVRPHGQTQLEATFGKPCNRDANFNRFTWTAEGVVWKVNFHKKLGGSPIPNWYEGSGGTSSNLFHDVRGHIANDHLTMLGGIGSYNCRENSNFPGRWSVHAWGAAIDIFSSHQRNGECIDNAIPPEISRYFEIHNWYWLECDKMHFQYVTGF